MSDSEISIANNNIFKIDTDLLSNSSEEDLKYIDILIFEVCGKKFGLENTGIQGILKPQKITPAPLTEDFVLGLINVRGEIISCIDSGLFLFTENIEINKKSRIIIIGDRDISTSLLVSSICGIEGIQEDKMGNSPENGKGFVYELLNCIIDKGKESIAVLNINKILNSNRLKNYEKK